MLIHACELENRATNNYESKHGYSTVSSFIHSSLQLLHVPRRLVDLSYTFTNPEGTVHGSDQSIPPPAAASAMRHCYTAGSQCRHEPPCCPTTSHSETHPVQHRRRTPE